MMMMMMIPIIIIMNAVAAVTVSSLSSLPFKIRNGLAEWHPQKSATTQSLNFRPVWRHFQFAPEVIYDIASILQSPWS